MKSKIKVDKEVEIVTLSVRAGVRYWEDATVNGVEDENGDLIPCREDDYWCPEIDVDNGIITNWTKGVKADIHYKVCDDGTYVLKDKEGNEITTQEGYVPSVMSPKENGYGDYIIMDVDVDGKISDWDSKVINEDFLGEEED